MMYNGGHGRFGLLVAQAPCGLSTLLAKPIKQNTVFPGRLAQLVRALLLHRRGRGFESLSAHKPHPCEAFIYIYTETYLKWVRSFPQGDDTSPFEAPCGQRPQASPLCELFPFHTCPFFI